MSYWAAARCQTWREKIVAERIAEELGAVVFLPKARLAFRKTHRPSEVALFPGYLFIDLDQSPPWQAIRRYPTVIGFVMVGEAPARCPDREIAKLMAAEIGGIIKLALAPPPAPPRYRPAIGQKIKIRFGALDGLAGSYAGEIAKARKSRSRVLVELLGRQVFVEIPSHAIAT